MIRFANDLGGTMEPAPSLSHEYGDMQCTVDVVENLREATEFIASHGSAHTESIVTENGKLLLLSKRCQWLTLKPR